MLFVAYMFKNKQNLLDAAMSVLGVNDEPTNTCKAGDSVLSSWQCDSPWHTNSTPYTAMVLPVACRLTNTARLDSYAVAHDGLLGCW